MPNNGNVTPIMTASEYGMTPVVRYLALLGCSLSQKETKYGDTALDWARHYNQHDTARLISDIESAGGWRPYAATRRMAYVRIRHEVSKTYAMLPKTKKLRKLRALLHFVFGRNRDVVGTAAAEASGDGFEKPEAMQVLPDDVFALVCRMLE